VKEVFDLSMILVFAFFVAAICLITIWFRAKIKKLNNELKEKDKQIVRKDADLQNKTSVRETSSELIPKLKDESDNHFRSLVETASDAISYYDSEGDLKYANPAFYELIGLNPCLYYKSNPADLIHPDDREFDDQRTEALGKNGFFDTEYRIRHREGHYLSLSSRSVALKGKNGEMTGFITIDRDITKLKQVLADLAKANFDSEASNRLKTSFLANISHEIRTPLNSVVGFSNLLLSDGLTRDVREEYIEHINHNSEKLLQIIGDIIDLSRLESSQIEITYEETSLSSIVNEIIEDARQVIRRNEKPIILNVKNQFEDNGDLIFSDRVWLKRVLNHLMDNAVKFTLDGSIEFSYFKENENIVFKIKDTGIGIKKENLGRIFEEFRQEVGGHHRPFEGLGIGLTLAKEVVERMGGRIYVQSEKGIGSEFSFSIPYKPAGSTKIRAASLNTNHFLKPIDWSAKKCLLVDDNKDVLIYLNRILSDTGITTVLARSGIEAIEIIKAMPDIDVVLLDMQMPEMNGIEATKEIRKIRKNLPIIAQTAFVFEDDKDIIIEAGCEACLIKPIRKEHLLTVMSSFVKSQ
jgi:PAS domain S-box-containing protein